MSVAAPIQPESQQKYVIAMSEDDDLCKPLLAFYNAHILEEDDEAKGYLEDRFGGALQPPGPVFRLGGPPWGREMFPQWASAANQTHAASQWPDRTCGAYRLDAGRPTTHAMRSRVPPPPDPARKTVMAY